MKSKADGWLYLGATLAIAGVLFLPLAVVESGLKPWERFNPETVPSLLAWFLAALGFWGFRARFLPHDERECGRLRSGVLLLILQALLVRTTFEAFPLAAFAAYAWMPSQAWIWTPWFLIPALTSILIGSRFGVIACLMGVLMLYLVVTPPPFVVLGCLAASFTGVLLLRRSPTRSRVLRAGSGAGVALGAVAAVDYGFKGASIDVVAASVLVPLGLGLISAFLVLAILPVLEWVLGELSDVTLVEYGTDHRLLDELREKAPGTWHHSVNVADISEKAAAEIGARALFCKTAALYHDIGKLKNPSLFAENTEGPSPHDQLDPQSSAREIIDHVNHGLELARKHRLPKVFREIIAEHHGVSLVRFFYAKACEQARASVGSSINRAAFCYPGPPPSSRESGIIALADVVEAASRSFASRAEPEIRAFVTKLIADRISDGELAQCPLTLAELARIEGVFVKWLKGRNHFRPAYPNAASAPVPNLTSPEDRPATQPA